MSFDCAVVLALEEQVSVVSLYVSCRAAYNILESRGCLSSSSILFVCFTTSLWAGSVFVKSQSLGGFVMYTVHVNLVIYMCEM